MIHLLDYGHSRVICPHVPNDFITHEFSADISVYVKSIRLCE